MEEGKKEETGAPAPPAAAPRDGELTKELERVRGRHKVLKIVTIVLSAFFLVLVVAAAFIYHRISEFTSMFRNLDADSQYALSAPYAPISQPPQGSLPDMYSSTEPAVSSLMMLSGLSYSSSAAQGQPQGLPSFQPKNVLGLMAKYGERPIVKAFIAELSKDPAFKKAMARDGDPTAIARIFQNKAQMQTMMMKFAMRPDFMPFMTEVMNDPDVLSLLSSSPGGSQALQRLKGGAPQSGGAPLQQISPMTVQDLQSSTGGARIDPSDLAAPAPIKTKNPPPMSE